MYPTHLYISSARHIIFKETIRGSEWSQLTRLFTFIMSILAERKGDKQSAVNHVRDEGTGGTSGIVLSLEQVGTGVTNV